MTTKETKLVKDLKNEVMNFYDLEITDEVTLNFVKWYFKNKRNPCIDTSEREDFMCYLEDLDLIRLK
jgi:hypothetical protein